MGSVTVIASPISYPLPPFVIVTSDNIPVRVATRATPSPVVADISSPTTKVPLICVKTNSIILIVPNFRVVTLDTKAVVEEVAPVIVKPLKSK